MSTISYTSHSDEPYYIIRTPESLLLTDRSIKISARVDCIIQLDPLDILMIGQ
jgi:hypothetical protein